MKNSLKKEQGLILLIGLLLVNLLLAACSDTNNNSSNLPIDAVGTIGTCNKTIIPAKTLTSPGSGRIRIYSSLPLTGGSRDQSQTLVNAMQLALDDAVRTDPALAALGIEYVSLDDATAKTGEWDKDTEAANATRVVNDPAAVVYLGPFNSGAAQISIPILNQASIAVLSPSATRVGLTKKINGLTAADEPDKYYPTKTRNFFRLVASDDLQGQAGANYAYDTLKARRYFVIDDSGAYGKGLADAFEKGAKSRGASIAARRSIDGSEADYRALARDIQSSGADLVFYGGSAQHQPGRLLADIRASGINAPFLGGDGLNDPAFVKQAGIAGEGAFNSISGVSQSALPEKGKEFLERYRSYGEPTAYTIYGFEIMNVALKAIKAVGKPDRAAILKNIAETKDYDGALGKWSFNADGDSNLNKFTFYKVQNGCQVNQ